MKKKNIIIVVMAILVLFSILIIGYTIKNNDVVDKKNKTSAKEVDENTIAKSLVNKLKDKGYKLDLKDISIESVREINTSKIVMFSFNEVNKVYFGLAAVSNNNIDIRDSYCISDNQIENVRVVNINDEKSIRKCVYGYFTNKDIDSLSLQKSNNKITNILLQGSKNFIYISDEDVQIKQIDLLDKSLNVLNSKSIKDNGNSV